MLLVAITMLPRSCFDEISNEVSSMQAVFPMTPTQIGAIS